MHVRHVLLAAFVSVFIALATVALDKPGYYYDEVIFVPVSLRALGDCDVDAAVTAVVGCRPLMQTLGYVGAVKAWLHAPLVATFGSNVWTVRLPSILVGAAALVVLWLFARRELGTAWAVLLLALLAADPVLVNHARLDWGPQMLAALMRVMSLAALWRWLQTGGTRWLVVLCAALLLGFWDKLNFIWVIAAWAGAAALVAWRVIPERLRSGAPWQPTILAVTGALLAWGTATLVRRAARLDTLGDAGTLGIAGQVAKVWHLYAATFSGTSVVGWVFGIATPVTSAFNALLILQLVGAALLLALGRPWSPARRLLAFLTAATLLLLLAIVATPQVAGSHHLIMLWPLPTLHLVTLLAIASQRTSDAAQPGVGMRAPIAIVGAVVCGAMLAWNVAIDLRAIDAWRNDRDFQPRFDPAIAALATRLAGLDVERVIAVDWGLHQPLVTLARREHAARYREWTWQLIDAPDLERDELQRAVEAHVAGRRVAFVLYTAPFTAFAGAPARLDAFLVRYRPCRRHDQTVPNAAGKPLYRIVVADYRDCGAARPGDGATDRAPAGGRVPPG